MSGPAHHPHYAPLTPQQTTPARKRLGSLLHSARQHFLLGPNSLPFSAQKPSAQEVSKSSFSDWNQPSDESPVRSGAGVAVRRLRAKSMAYEATWNESTATKDQTHAVDTTSPNPAHQSSVKGFRQFLPHGSVKHRRASSSTASHSLLLLLSQVWHAKPPQSNNNSFEALDATTSAHRRQVPASTAHQPPSGASSADPTSFIFPTSRIPGSVEISHQPTPTLLDPSIQGGSVEEMEIVSEVELAFASSEPLPNNLRPPHSTVQATPVDQGELLHLDPMLASKVYRGKAKVFETTQVIGMDQGQPVLQRVEVGSSNAATSARGSSAPLSHASESAVRSSMKGSNGSGHRAHSNHRHRDPHSSANTISPTPPAPEPEDSDVLDPALCKALQGAYYPHVIPSEVSNSSVATSGVAARIAPRDSMPSPSSTTDLSSTARALAQAPPLRARVDPCQVIQSRARVTSTSSLQQPTLSHHHSNRDLV